MRLTRAITTTTPRYVQTVHTIRGKVWHVNPPHGLVLTFPDGTNRQYRVPDGTMFDIKGQKQSIFNVRKGMVVSATIVRDVPGTEVSSTRMVTGEAPPPAPTPPDKPQEVGVLLIEAQNAPAEPHVAQNTLPKTAARLRLSDYSGSCPSAYPWGSGNYPGNHRTSATLRLPPAWRSSFRGSLPVSPTALLFLHKLTVLCPRRGTVALNGSLHNRRVMCATPSFA